MDDAVPDAVLVCLRVQEDSIGSVVPGSIQERCYACDHRVWVSKSGQALVSSGVHKRVRYECIECTRAAAEKDENILKNASIAPGAIQEMAAHLREGGKS